MEKAILINVFVIISVSLEVGADKPDCPPDKPKVYCFVPPCDESSCVVQGASCVSTSCGGCLAIWSDSKGRRLDDRQCTAPPSTTTTNSPSTTAINSHTASKSTTPEGEIYVTQNLRMILKQKFRQQQQF
ncbi:uncharacterized protein LOC117342486 isoform X2 [Pecten maximus]|uniref:uncharacterized protein LOC117342486 isoform X2 n=1 Tax=Pecten maximus TaxID=6579 RepID=UPI001458D37E|nr:uncharacterized protein LOC117342486 isoform X2 [Pecten maximus]